MLQKFAREDEAIRFGGARFSRLLKNSSRPCNWFNRFCTLEREVKLRTNYVSTQRLTELIMCAIAAA